MNQYLAFYHDGQRWKLASKELTTDRQHCLNLLKPYEASGYKTKVKSIDLPEPRQ